MTTINSVISMQRWAARLLGGVVFCLAFSQISACGQPWWLPPAHKIEIQQGNLISESQKNGVEIGQSRDDILDKLGQPVLNSVFKSDRWDYVYSRGPAGAAVETRKLTLLFENDRVSEIIDNYDEVTGELQR